ncbi:sugar kinase [Aeromonas veronii]
MKRIAFIGECMIELNGKPFGLMKQTYGGDTLNTAVYLSRISQQKDIQVLYVTAMGSDTISRQIVAAWMNEGIDTSLVLEDSHHQPGLYIIQLNDSGERTFLYWRNNSAARYLFKHAEIDHIKAMLNEVDAIYLSGISLAILPVEDRHLMIDMLHKLKVVGKTIIFDSNYRVELWHEQEDTRYFYRQILGLTSLALVTFDDEQALWGNNSLSDVLLNLKMLGVSEAVVKTGADGCIYQDLRTEDAPIVFHTRKIEHVVDTTAAGDSFNAGYISGYLFGAPPEVSASRGNKLASIVIQHQGAIIPINTTLNVIDSLYNNNPI